MKIHKVKVHGKPKYSVAVPFPSKEKYDDGRIKEKRFTHTKRHQAVYNAEQWLESEIAKLSIKESEENNQKNKFDKIPLGEAYDEYYLTCQARVNKKKNDPFVERKKGLTQDAFDRYQTTARSLFIFLAGGKPMPNGGKIAKEQKHKRDKLEQEGRNIPISYFTKSIIKKILNKMDSQEKPSQAKRMFDIFHCILKEAEISDLMGDNWTAPTSSLLHLRPSYTGGGEEAVDVPVMEKVLITTLKYIKEHNSHHALIILLQMFTGARWGEMAALKPSNFDYNNNTIIITHSRSSHTNEVSLTKAGHLKKKKISRGARVVTVDSNILKVIKLFIKINNINFNDFITPQVNLYDGTRKILKEITAEAGHKFSITKMFRYFNVSVSRNKMKVSDDEAKQRFGWQKIDMENIYRTYEDPNGQKHANQFYQILTNGAEV